MIGHARERAIVTTHFDYCKNHGLSKAFEKAIRNLFHILFYILAFISLFLKSKEKGSLKNTR